MRANWSALLTLAVGTAILAAQSTVPCEGPARIDRFAAQIDAKLKQLKVRTFVEASSEQNGGWHEATSPSEVEGTVASVYFENDVPVAAFFTIQTESGDWVLYASYYFRPNGTLAKRHEQLNTFNGNARVLRDTYLGCRGEVYRGATQHQNLESRKAKRPEPGFIDERAPLFRHVQKLPFSSALKRRN